MQCKQFDAEMILPGAILNGIVVDQLAPAAIRLSVA